MFIKIVNAKKETKHGFDYDYKGIELKDITPNSIAYKGDEIVCHIRKPYEGEDIQTITEREYHQFIVEIEQSRIMEPEIVFDPIDEEKLAMAEAIIQHEMEIQQLKAELAALKKGEE